VAYTKADMAGRRRACPSKVAKPRATEKKGNGTFTSESEIAGRPELTAAGAGFRAVFAATTTTARSRTARQTALALRRKTNYLPPAPEHARTGCAPEYISRNRNEVARGTGRGNLTSRWLAWPVVQTSMPKTLVVNPQV
jgi:hypothetical protein